MITVTTAVCLLGAVALATMLAFTLYRRHKFRTHPLNRWDETKYRLHSDPFLLEHIRQIQQEIDATEQYPHLTGANMPGLLVSNESQHFFDEVHPTVNKRWYRYGYALPMADSKKGRIVVFRKEKDAAKVKAFPAAVYVYGTFEQNEINQKVIEFYKKLKGSAIHAAWEVATNRSIPAIA